MANSPDKIPEKMKDDTIKIVVLTGCLLPIACFVGLDLTERAQLAQAPQARIEHSRKPFADEVIR